MQSIRKAKSHRFYHFRVVRTATFRKDLNLEYESLGSGCREYYATNVCSEKVKRSELTRKEICFPVCALLTEFYIELVGSTIFLVIEHKESGEEVKISFSILSVLLEGQEFVEEKDATRS